jgi:hypothetical protein
LTRTRRRHVPSERADRGPGARHSGDPCPSGAHQHHVRRVGHRLAVARNIEGAGTSKCPPLLRMRISCETACSARGECYLHPLCRASPRLANEARGRLGLRRLHSAWQRPRRQREPQDWIQSQAWHPGSGGYSSNWGLSNPREAPTPRFGQRTCARYVARLSRSRPGISMKPGISASAADSLPHHLRRLANEASGPRGRASPSG